MRRQYRIIPEYLSTPYWRQERQKTTAREECEPRSRAEPKLKREMDEQLHKHNGRFRIHRVETQTEPQKSGRRGEQQLPQQRPKKATHNTPKTPVSDLSGRPKLNLIVKEVVWHLSCKTIV